MGDARRKQPRIRIITEECKTLRIEHGTGRKQTEDYNMSDLEGLKLIPPLQVSPEQYPESGELPEGVKTVDWKDT